MPFIVGQSHQIEVAVTPDDVTRFAELSGDVAPLHTDAAFARRHGFDAPLVHGAFLASLISRLVGMDLPGPSAVLERMDLSFRAPCHAPCALIVRGQVRQVSEAVASLVLDVTIADATGRALVTGKTWHRIL